MMWRHQTTNVAAVASAVAIGEAAAHWRSALEIYERLGTPNLLNVRVALESLTGAA